MEKPGKALGDGDDSEAGQQRGNKDHLQQRGNQFEECLEASEDVKKSD